MTIIDLLERADAHRQEFGPGDAPPLIVTEDEGRQMAIANCEHLAKSGILPPNHFDECFAAMRGYGVHCLGIKIRIGEVFPVAQ